MRFQFPARRVILAPMLGLALIAAASACSSSGSSGTTTPPSATASSAPAGSPSAVPASSTAAPATSAPANAAAEITANWEKFFDSSTSVAEKAKLLENGGTFSSAIQSLVNLPLASGLGAKVTAVVVNSATTATVSYNIVAGGSTLLANQTGKAVYQDGIWKVGDATLCNLFKLIPGGSVPSACSSVS
jgi:hypothetical protein